MRQWPGDGEFKLAYTLIKGPPGGPAEGRIKMLRHAYAGAVLAATVLATVLSTPADAQRDRVQVGSLECSLSSGIGLIVGSQRNMRVISSRTVVRPRPMSGR